MEYIDRTLTPEQILNSPLLNKGTAFTQEERDAIGLNGFLPFHVGSMEEQLQRRYQNFLASPDDLSKYIYLSSLQDRNEILFFRLVHEHIAEMLPLIYTPTVGDVSLNFSLLYRHHRGIYLSYPLRNKITEIIDQIPQKEIDVIVVTDGERILGLGDVGIGGMAIPKGKLSLYTLFGGIHPARTLPVLLDVGTNNERLLNDPVYLGWRHLRITGKEYEDFIELFVSAIQKRYPKVLLQWEDFAKPHAHSLLEKYRDRICSFNDDIQGTGAVVLAGVLSGVRSLGGQLKNQKIVIFGGGSAGLGIAHFLLEAMQLEGLSEEIARQNFYIIDRDGLVHSQLEHVSEGQKQYARAHSEISQWKIQNPSHITLLETIQHAHPHVLIGVSAQPGAFTEEVVTAMAASTVRPIIFPLSNPLSKCEADPQDLIRWTKGRAIIASGSPFPPVHYAGKNYPIAQCNNVNIFPGVGLGVIASQSSQVIEKMFIQAAYRLSTYSPLIKDPQAALFPPFEQLRLISRHIAVTVATIAQEEGLCPKMAKEAIEALIDRTMWFPEYPTYLRAAKAFS